MSQDTTSQDHKIKVVYILGFGRSGSTLLDRMLGQIPGFFSIGELRLWDTTILNHEHCGCGNKLLECKIWKEVFESAFGDGLNSGMEAMLELRKKTRSRYLAFQGIPGTRKKFLRNLLTNLDVVRKIYTAIEKTTKCKVIVDSSKLPSYGLALKMLDTVELYVVHIVRDPRGAAYSWQKKVFLPKSGRRMPIYAPVKSAFFWSLWNIEVSIFQKKLKEHYYLLRYEDLIAHPRKITKELMHFLGETNGGSLEFFGDHAVTLKENHTVSGNKMRFQTGLVPLKVDEEWRQKMTFRDKVIVSFLTWPWLLRYGYLGTSK